MVVYVNFRKDIFMFEAAMASEVLLHNGVYSTALPFGVEVIPGILT